MNLKALAFASLFLLAGAVAVAAEMQESFLEETEEMTPENDYAMTPTSSMSISTGRDMNKMDIGQYWDNYGHGHYYASWNDGFYYRFSHPDLPGMYFASEWWLNEYGSARGCNRCSLCPSC